MNTTTNTRGVEIPGLIEMSDLLRKRGVETRSFRDHEIAEAAFRAALEAALSAEPAAQGEAVALTADRTAYFVAQATAAATSGEWDNFAEWSNDVLHDGNGGYEIQPVWDACREAWEKSALKPILHAERARVPDSDRIDWMEANARSVSFGKAPQQGYWVHVQGADSVYSHNESLRGAIDSARGAQAAQLAAAPSQPKDAGEVRHG